MCDFENVTVLMSVFILIIVFEYLCENPINLLVLRMQPPKMKINQIYKMNL